MLRTEVCHKGPWEKPRFYMSSSLPSWVKLIGSNTLLKKKRNLGLGSWDPLDMATATPSSPFPMCTAASLEKAKDAGLPLDPPMDAQLTQTIINLNYPQVWFWFAGLLGYPAKFWDEVASILFPGDFCQALMVLGDTVAECAMWSINSK